LFFWFENKNELIYQVVKKIVDKNSKLFSLIHREPPKRTANLHQPVRESLGKIRLPIGKKRDKDIKLMIWLQYKSSIF
jgi:hypothetical protein